MILDLRIRLALVIGGVIIAVVALAGSSWGSLALDYERVLTVLGALLAGLGVAGGPSKGAAVVLLMASALTTGGCGARCVTERNVVNALGAGIAASSAVVPENAASVREALGHASAVTGLGRAAVDACELLRDGAGWQAWVELALEAAVGLAAHFGGAADSLPSEPPDELGVAIRALELELER